MMKTGTMQMQAFLKVDPNAIESFIRSFTIPCQPRVVEALDRELERKHPDLDSIAILIANDVSLSAAVLQVANIPSFRHKMHGDKPFESIDEAIKVLGVERVNKIVKTLEFRDKVWATPNVHFDRFWDSASDVAVIAAHLAKRTLADPAQAYTLGLFRDCGIAVLLQAVPRYKEALTLYDQQTEKTLSEIEVEMFGIDHRAVGYALSRMWRLPEIIQRAILTHHDIEPPSSDVETISAKKNLLNSIVLIAEKIHARFRSFQHQAGGHKGWHDIHPYVAGHLGMEIEDVVEMIDDTYEQMETLLQSHAL